MTREERIQATRLEVRRAAVELFDELGFDETTIDQIADRARIGRRTFFRYFASKESVLFGDDAFRFLMDDLESGLDAGLHPVEAVHRAFERTASTSQPPDEFTVMRRQIRARYRDHPAVRGHYQALVSQLEDEIVNTLTHHSSAQLHHRLLPLTIGVLVRSALLLHLRSGELRNATGFSPDWGTAVTELSQGLRLLGFPEPELKRTGPSSAST